MAKTDLETAIDKASSIMVFDRDLRGYREVPKELARDIFGGLTSDDLDVFDTDNLESDGRLFLRVELGGHFSVSLTYDI